MNEQNLIPNEARTPNELRDITRKGGIKSGEVRRRNRDIKKIVAALLQAAPEDRDTAERLALMGIDERDITNKAAMVLTMYDEAMKGNVKAFETLMRYSGEDPDQERKDAELLMKRDLHLLEINNRDRFGFDILDDTQERQKRYIMRDIKDRYPELKDARDEVLKEDIAAASYDEDDEEDED